MSFTERTNVWSTGGPGITWGTHATLFQCLSWSSEPEKMPSSPKASILSFIQVTHGWKETSNYRRLMRNAAAPSTPPGCHFPAPREQLLPTLYWLFSHVLSLLQGTGGYHYYPFPCGHRLATFRNKVCINSSRSLSTPTCHSTQLGNSLG